MSKHIKAFMSLQDYYQKWRNEDEIWIMYNETGAVYDTDYQNYLETQMKEKDEFIEVIELVCEKIQSTDSLTVAKEYAEKLLRIINDERT